MNKLTGFFEGDLCVPLSISRVTDLKLILSYLAILLILLKRWFDLSITSVQVIP
jgi:hypothetical protein